MHSANKRMGVSGGDAPFWGVLCPARQATPERLLALIQRSLSVHLPINSYVTRLEPVMAALAPKLRDLAVSILASTEVGRRPKGRSGGGAP